MADKKNNSTIKYGYSQIASPKAERFHRLVFGFMVCLATLSFSSHLADMSNIVRFTFSATALFIALIFGRKYLKNNLPITIGTVTLVLFVCLQAISILWASNKAEAIFEIAKWVIVSGTLLFSYSFARHKPAHFIAMMACASSVIFVISFIVAIYQMCNLGDFSWSSRYAISSLFTHKGTYSMMILLTMAFPLLRLRLRSSHIVKALYITLLVAQIGMILFLQARATWVAVVAIIIALVVMRFRIPYKWHTVIAATSIFCVIVIGGSRLFSQYELSEPGQEGGLRANASIYERQALWRMTFRMVDKQPVLGCGAGNWKVCYPSVGTEDVFSINILDYNFTRPHNDYLRLLSETGYIGFILIITALISLLLRTLSTKKNRHGKMARLSAAFIAGVMAFALFDFPIDRMEILIWITILCATVAIFSLPKSVNKQTERYKGLYFASLVLIAPSILIGITRWYSETHYAAIVSGIHNRQWKDVEEHCHEALTPWYNLTPLGMPLAYYEGMAREYQNKPAIESFRTALKAAPWCKQVLSDLGRLEYTKEHNTDTAILLLQKAIAISPAYSYAYFNLAQLYLYEQNFEKTVEVLDMLDLDKKEDELRRMTWHYHQGKTADYYTNKLVPAERKTMQRIRNNAEQKMNIQM